MEAKGCRYPLSIQLTLPESYRSDEGFRASLAFLREQGFVGVELNIGRLDQVRPEELKSFLESYNLNLTMYASGAAAKLHGLSLSHEDPETKGRSVEACRKMIDFASCFGAGVILGFIKGSPEADRKGAYERFRESLCQLTPHAEARRVTLLVEATNRYESAVANRLEEAVELIRDFRNSYLRILPDTFHMNIEESDLYASLRLFSPYYCSLHVSDNNRLYPGLGGLDFKRLFHFLKKMGFRGGIAIEGNVKESVVDDLRKSMRCLAPLLKY